MATVNYFVPVDITYIGEWTKAELPSEDEQVFVLVPGRLSHRQLYPQAYADPEPVYDTVVDPETGFVDLVEIEQPEQEPIVYPKPMSKEDDVLMQHEIEVNAPLEYIGGYFSLHGGEHKIGMGHIMDAGKSDGETRSGTMRIITWQSVIDFYEFTYSTTKPEVYGLPIG
jgi:hypothetical protein